MNKNKNLFNNMIFVGGIHGVGKSTICRKLATDLHLNYLSASEVLKWKDINTNEKNKLVSDIPDTQDRLINGLKNTVDHDNKYILDGHFCLFNHSGVATEIPIKTFLIINPIFLVVVKGEVSAISESLKNRDQENYSVQSLSYMQTMELEYANKISIELNAPLFIFDVSHYNQSYNALLSQLYESLT